MARLNKIIQARNDGLLIALKIVKEKGVEGLEDEIKFRNITGLHTKYSKSELEEAEEKFKRQVVLYYQAASLFTLKEKFGFGKVRLKRYHDMFEDLCDSVIRDYLTLEDIVDYLKDEYDIELKYKDE